MYVYHLLKDFRKYAFEISRREVYFDLVRNVIKDIQQGYFNNKISIKAYNYACRHIESVAVEKIISHLVVNKHLVTKNLNATKLH